MFAYVISTGNNFIVSILWWCFFDTEMTSSPQNQEWQLQNLTTGSGSKGQPNNVSGSERCMMMNWRGTVIMLCETLNTYHPILKLHWTLFIVCLPNRSDKDVKNKTKSAIVCFKSISIASAVLFWEVFCESSSCPCNQVKRACIFLVILFSWKRPEWCSLRTCTSICVLQNDMLNLPTRPFVIHFFFMKTIQYSYRMWICGGLMVFRNHSQAWGLT